MKFSIVDFLRSGAVISSSQDKLLVGWGDPQRMEKSKIDPAKPAFYFNDFFLETSQPWHQYAEWMEIERVEFFELLKLSFSIDPCSWTIYQPEKFKQAFDELAWLLQCGALQKGVPYLFMHATERMSILRLQFCLQHGLIELNEGNSYLYGHWDLSHGVLGITPELLFSSRGSDPKIVRTMALAGTCRPSDCKTTFFEDPKQRCEHQVVVRGIKESLESLGSVKIGEMQLLELPKLTHLMTPIEVNLTHSFDFDAMVHALHPTPALGAFPKAEGMLWLKKFQQHSPRQYYGAPVGFLSSQAGFAQCFAGIRNVQWGGAGMWIGMGCGVVKQSCFDSEWEEIQLKGRAIREQFNL